MSDECLCTCHLPNMLIMHVAPCCLYCDICGKNIKMQAWSQHNSLHSRRNKSKSQDEFMELLNNLTHCADIKSNNTGEIIRELPETVNYEEIK